MSKNLKQIIGFLQPFKKQIAAYFSFNLIAIIFNLISLAMVIPFLRILFDIEKAPKQVSEFQYSIQGFLDYFNFTIAQIIANESKAKALLMVCILVAFVFLIKNLFSYLAMYVLSPIRTGVTKNLRNQLYNKLLCLPVSFFSEEKKGDILTKMSVDVAEVEQSIISTLLLFFKEPFHLILFIFALFYISPSLTLFVFIFIPIGGFVISKIAQFLKSSAKQTQKKLGNLIANVEETLTGINVIKIFNAKNYKIKKFENEVESLKKVNTKMLRLKDLASPSSEFIAIILVVTVLWYGGNLVLNGTSTLDAETFIAFIVIFSQIIPPAKSVASAYSNLQKGYASLDRINNVLYLEEENDLEGKDISSFNNKIEFQNVSFAYNHKNVLNDISFNLEKGKTLALVGQSGSGKSTIANLLIKFYKQYAGNIFIDKNELKTIKSKSIRNLVSVVSQNPILFNDSIYNNIVFGLENISEEEVYKSAKIARVHDFIMTLENAYQTNIGEGGSKLSGGEKQRITIARAILKNAEILILDEATSALDSENETLVKEAISILMKEKTVLIIAHRLATVQNADNILVLKDGNIIESGNHQTLLQNKKSTYKKLVELQNV